LEIVATCQVVKSSNSLRNFSAMSQGRRVKIVDIGRKFLALRWIDPQTGQEKQRSAKTSNRKDAERLAGEIEADLRHGRCGDPDRLSWELFRERFEDEKLPLLAPATVETYSASLNVIQRCLNPAKVSDLTAARLSYFQAQLTKEGARPATIARHLRHIKAALNWGHEMGLIRKPPKIKIPRQPKGAKLMRGRPLTPEEFQRMLDVVPDVVGESRAESWRYFLRGLWWSGLRLQEATQLYWDRQDRLSVDFTNEFPMLRILSDFEKGKKDRLLPMAPEFAEFLEATPSDARSGLIFEPAGPGKRPRRGWYSNKGSAIGKAAKIIISTDSRSGKPQYASLHDLRRSFGERWSQRLLPQQLMILMRHESIETTLSFYVGQNSVRTAQEIWNSVGKAPQPVLNGVTP